MRYWKSEEYSNLPDGNYVIYNPSGNPYMVMSAKFLRKLGNLYKICYGPLENVKDKVQNETA